MYRRGPSWPWPLPRDSHTNDAKRPAFDLDLILRRPDVFCFLRHARVPEITTHSSTSPVIGAPQAIADTTTRDRTWCRQPMPSENRGRARHSKSRKRTPRCQPRWQEVALPPPRHDTHIRKDLHIATIGIDPDAHDMEISSCPRGVSTAISSRRDGSEIPLPSAHGAGALRDG
jgi:hypothetical protein